MHSHADVVDRGLTQAHGVELLHGDDEHIDEVVGPREELDGGSLEGGGGAVGTVRAASGSGVVHHD